MRHFVALQTFTAPETRSEYVEGMSYTIRQGNRYLNALAEVWALQGKVSFTHHSKKAVVKGAGVVVSPPPPPPQVVYWSPHFEPSVLQDEPVVVKAHTLVEMPPPPLIVEEPPKPAPIPLAQDEMTIWEKTKSAWRSLWQ